MPTLLDFRRRIRSVKNTEQITRAMKFVAAARLRRAQEAALAARPYAQELGRILRSTLARIQEPEHVLLEQRPEEKILVLVLSGERGLAGPFNANLLRKAHEFFRSHRSKQIVTIPVGKKGRDALKKAGVPAVAEYVNVLTRVQFKTARELALLAAELYAKRDVDSVYMIFSEFKTVMTANLVVEKLLPFETLAADQAPPGQPSTATTATDYIYEQPEAQLLDKLLPRYLETQVLRAMLESSAAEYAARMTAMESATKNAGEVIEALTLHMNKVRQATITKELIEIVSGATYGT